MVESPKRLPAAFFRTGSGGEPVREGLKSDLFSRADRRRIGASIKTVGFGWPIGMPTCRPLGGEPWEIRIALNNRIARVLFCVHAETMVLLHGFIKKTRAAPQAEIALARQRMTILERPQ